ncbi:MAG: AAA family ATPase [Clostridiales bacterium GWF2_38_85]|nr:MAG: AAA family ATPase [Clostridiales bacterium GWF2_38_85]
MYDYNFKVAEASEVDVGKAIIRIDINEIINLGVGIGDIVEIKGKSSAVARILPVQNEKTGRDIILMDEILRKNAGVETGEQVSIKHIDTENAQIIILCCIDKKESTFEDIKKINILMDGIPVIKDNHIKLKMTEYNSNEYIVVETKPEGVVRITQNSIIKIKNEGAVKKDNRVSYEDIGGFDKQVLRIREMIELPLKFPELFNQLGIEAPKGLLLYGPPGTGKTLIARAVANETKAYFIHINGPEIINKFYGESEAKLREIFEIAKKNAPSIIFLDEIDAISPKRENVNGDVEKRVVAQLLALMDGINDRGQVIIIGATNIPNAIDPALRRPGRFDREIEIGIPDKNARYKILLIHTRDMPLDDTVDLNKLAEFTHGYVGADLQSLCREAAMSAFRKISIVPDLAPSIISESIISNLKVTMDDFYSSLNEIEPSAIREIFVEIPNTSFDDIGGLNYIKKKITENIIWPDKYRELYNFYGCRVPKGILFYGAPGTGKTLVAKAIASFKNSNFISIKGPEILSKWVGESEKGLREVFKKAKQAAPCIIFFDEIDSLVPARGRNSDNDTTGRIICQMLSEIDGIEELNGVTIIGATNRLDIVDPALLRPGRFDILLEFKVPDLGDRIEIFKIHLKNKPIADDVNIIMLANMSEGYTGADIMDLCQRAALNALSEYIEKYGNDINTKNKKRVISLANFLNIIETR